jgi:hypothetical protein
MPVNGSRQNSDSSILEPSGLKRENQRNHQHTPFLPLSLSKYGIELVNPPNNPKMLRAGLMQSLKQTNELDVVAVGSDIKVFVNRQFVAEVQDSTLPLGYVGVCVDTDMSDPAQANVTTAVFKNAKIWT